MLKYIEVTGKNEEDAIARALAQLGLDRDDVSVEVLERAKTGCLGIGSTPAKIKVTYEGPDEVPEEVIPPAPEPEPESKKPQIKESKPVRERPQRPRPAARPPKAEQPAPKPAAEPVKPAAPAEGEDEITGRIVGFMTGLFQHMEVAAVPQVTKNGDTYEVVLQGENLGSLIGRRGETLDAIQQLTGYAVNHGRSKRVRIHVDAENYRARREESLQRLANKVAGKVVKYRRSVTLEPMNAYERHVIHAALQDYPRVTTFSTGTEPNRRTVVAYDPDKN